MIGAEPVIEKRRWLSPVWLLPFIALLLAGGFIYQQFASSGQLIRINFAQGNGNPAGQDPGALSGGRHRGGAGAGAGRGWPQDSRAGQD